MAHVESIGVESYLEEQLDPDAIDETDNAVLASREGALFRDQSPYRNNRHVVLGDVWMIRKGTSEPPAGWKDPGFDDSSPDWFPGRTGVGYGDDDDETVLTDMMDNYLSVYLRKKFTAENVLNITDLVLNIDYDDGFVCYINGTEVARRNVFGGGPPPYSRTAGSANSHPEDAGPEKINLNSRTNLLVEGPDNVLSIQVHNANFGSSDLSIQPELSSSQVLPGPSTRVIRGVDELQQLVHMRGVYSRRQLRAVLAEFWENHFTTDLDKLVDYLDNLRNSDEIDAMSESQARDEAARMELREYQFFHDNALGDFGDLLLFSATSPAMLIYLDNVFNFKGNPNENYAREILELSAFGVDNRYIQGDIEELARCFTGWSICKVDPTDALPFPESAFTLPADCGVDIDESVFLDLGSGWKYFKGTREPTPDADGVPTIEWTEVSYNDSAWINGNTGIGYGDGDDATTLGDMRNGYAAVYLRREFTVADPAALDNLILTVDYDDGYTAYLNGYQVARSETMAAAGPAIPAFNFLAAEHEVTDGTDSWNLDQWRFLLQPAPAKNVLSIQVHNKSLDSSDLSMRPRLVERETLEGGLENGDPNGDWTFYFDSTEHDTGAKTLFASFPQYRIDVPAGRTGAAGVLDAREVIDAMVNHPSTREFICIKLIQKFVSDEISLNTFKLTPQTVPIELRELLADCTNEWRITGGNIEAMMRVILDPADRTGAFWSSLAYRSKVKTPIEFINSSIRILDGVASGQSLPDLNDAMGMHLFTRDTPDGWPESGADLLDTGSLLERIEFGRALAGNSQREYGWNTSAVLDGLDTAEETISEFVNLMFPDALPPSTRELLLEYLSTDDNGDPLPLVRGLDDFIKRTEEVIGLMLALPEWQFQ